ncbi:hypothetical protein MAPG_06694 [Magnaporthiopsis poae ATCC 64411]|uniref:Uncharacterized protein n=1 Tax=Magnaporthiopsis poae (strain ATCC 64411 / 73-15) TaxID=644358 RepID=A0A0C4E2Q4_MAGP6|nr:hypothetical protein MAPG_06694 [Magnaporthiopsis poae ATCC 64411]
MTQQSVTSSPKRTGCRLGTHVIPQPAVSAPTPLAASKKLGHASTAGDGNVGVSEHLIVASISKPCDWLPLSVSYCPQCQEHKRQKGSQCPRP